VKIFHVSNTSTRDDGTTLEQACAMANEINAIEVAILEKIKVMVMLMSLSNITSITSFKSSKVEDHKWHDVNIKLLIEEFMRKKQIET
jgi:hypothetical protein